MRMTTFLKVEKKCAVCGATSQQAELGSTSIFGKPDLDGRPAELARSTIDMWVERCPSCGYCAKDLSEAEEGASEVVQTARYRSQLDDEEYPQLANSFLCLSLIQEHMGSYAKAGWSSVHAAWACDDEKCRDAARRCRMRALTLFEQARKKGQAISREPGAEDARMVDLMRRSGLFESALELCDRALAKSPDATISRILGFERMLILGKDDACHTIEEALGEAGPGREVP